MINAYLFIVDKYIFSNDIINNLNNLSCDYNIVFLINKIDEKYINNLKKIFKFEIKIKDKIIIKEIKNIIYNDILDCLIKERKINKNYFNILLNENKNIINKYMYNLELYKDFNIFNFEYIDYMKSFLDKDNKRIQHSIQVSLEAYYISLHYLNINSIDLFDAGIFHDISKLLDINKQYNLAIKHGFYNNTDKYAYHQFASAQIYKDYVNNFNLNVYDAISCHCTGKKDMNIYDKILYFSDKYDINRYLNNESKLKEVNVLINLACYDFNLAFKKMKIDQINYFKNKKINYLSNKYSIDFYKDENNESNLISIVSTFKFE